MKIIHNPRCRKSRETLNLIISNTNKVEIIEYLKNPLTAKEIEDIVNLLKIEPEKLIRKNEVYYKEIMKGKKFNRNEILDILSKQPKLIERPIVFSKNKAIICRPPEKVLQFFNQESDHY